MSGYFIEDIGSFSLYPSRCGYIMNQENRCVQRYMLKSSLSLGPMVCAAGTQGGRGQGDSELVGTSVCLADSGNAV